MKETIFDYFCDNNSRPYGGRKTNIVHVSILMLTITIRAPTGDESNKIPCLIK